jgi:hypothetical protein
MLGASPVAARLCRTNVCKFVGVLACIVVFFVVKWLYTSITGCYHPLLNPWLTTDESQLWRTLAAENLIPGSRFEKLERAGLVASGATLDAANQVLRTVPLWLYITMTPERALRLDAGLKAHGLRSSASRAVRAVTPNDFVYNIRSPTKVTLETEVTGTIGAVVLSHLKAMKEAWESKKEWVIISEDDISFDYVNGSPQLKNHLLTDLIAELTDNHPSWSICMLGHTLCSCNTLPTIAQFLCTHVSLSY